MLKKFVIASAILAATTGFAVANPAPYVGISTGVTVNTMQRNIVMNAYRGVPLNVFAGYGGVVSQSFYLAGELTGTIGTANMSNHSTLKSSYGLGASILPGVMLSDTTLAYARVGVVDAKFPQLNNKARVGGQIGAGLQTNLTQNIDLRGEYDYVAYRTGTVKGTNNISVAPRADQFTVGLIYKFD